jgi:hypothetical protein
VLLAPDQPSPQEEPREPHKPGLALVTTDSDATVEQIVERYAARWSIEIAFADAKQITGVGEARNRTPGRRAHRLIRNAGAKPRDPLVPPGRALIPRRHRPPSSSTLVHDESPPSYHDMFTNLRRVLIAAQYCADLPDEPTPEQIRTIRLAWADAAA